MSSKVTWDKNIPLNFGEVRKSSKLTENWLETFAVIGKGSWQF